MKTGRIGMFSVLALAAALMNGCGMLEEKAWDPGETSLQMKKDGTLTEKIIDQLDQSYYSASELESMINSSVSEYNQGHGEDAVKIDSLSLENNQVALTMTYHSAQDYAEYNNVRFYNGSMLGAEMEGFLFYNQFKKVDKGEVTRDNISNEEPLKHKEYQVLVTDASHIVQVPGSIEYVSINADVMGEREAESAAENIVLEQEGLVLPSSAVYSEEGHAPVTAKDLEKTYLYILYDF